MCVCMYVCIHAYIYPIYMYIGMYVCMYICTYAYMYVSIYVGMHVCMLRGSSSIRAAGLQPLSTFTCFYVVYVRTCTHTNLANYQ